MNKTTECMAYGLSVVTPDLIETRVSAGEAGVCVEPGDIKAFATAWMALGDDEERRRKLSRLARRRVTIELDWAPQARTYVGVWEQMLGATHPVPVDTEPTWPARERRLVAVTAIDPLGRADVDLRDPAPQGAERDSCLTGAWAGAAVAATGDVLVIDLVALERSQVTEGDVTGAAVADPLTPWPSQRNASAAGEASASAAGTPP